MASSIKRKIRADKAKKHDFLIKLHGLCTRFLMMNDGAPKHSKLSFKGKATNVLTNAIPNTPNLFR